MMLKLVGILVISIITITSAQHQECPKDRKVIMCYWASWSIYRPGNGTHKIEFMEPEYCTHIIYTFAGLNLHGELDSLDYYNDITMGGYKKFIAMKEEYPCVKFMLAIGGWNEGSEKYSYMAESENRRNTFVESIVRYIIQFGFDGLDIDWEYPTERNGLMEDKDNFTKILELLYNELSKRKRILSVGASALQYIINKAYDVSEMCRFVDYVNIMGYDMQHSDKTSSHAPLRRESNEPATRETLETTVQHYIKSGCPKHKLILGIPAFGRSFTLRSSYSNGINSDISGLGNAGEISQTKGFMGFNEICEKCTTANGWRTYHLSKNAVKYSYKGDQWITYDDPETVKQKAKFVKDMGLGGVMLWSMDTDDFHGNCYSESYPLLLAANRILN